MAAHTVFDGEYKTLTASTSQNRDNIFTNDEQHQCPDNISNQYARLQRGTQRNNQLKPRKCDVKITLAQKLRLFLTTAIYYYYFFFFYPRYSVPAGFIKLGVRKNVCFIDPHRLAKNCQMSRRTRWHCISEQ